MHTPAGGSEAETGAPTAEPRRGEDTRYRYYMDREPTPLVEVFVCDHAYDCESLYREAGEEEVLALTGADALRAAQDECAWNGLGSKRYIGIPYRGLLPLRRPRAQPRRCQVVP